MFNSQRICAKILTCIGSVLAYSILEGYVHKFYVLPFWLVWGFVSACSILVGYVHDFMCSDLLDYFWMKDPLGMINVRDIFYVNWLIL